MAETARRVTYLIATSLDGFIAGPDGSIDAFKLDPAFLAELFARYPETCPGHLREARASRSSAAAPHGSTSTTSPPRCSPAA